MASRLLYSGASSSKPGDRKAASALPRPGAGKSLQSGSGGSTTKSGGTVGGIASGGLVGTGATSTAGPSSRLPQTSGSGFFGRSKGKTKEKQADKVAVSTQPPERSQIAATVSSLSPKKAITRTKPPSDTTARLTAASSIPRGLAPGMGVTTRITAGAPPSSATSQPARSLRRRPSLTSPHEKYANGESQSTPSTDGETYAMPREPVSTSDQASPPTNTILGITISEPEGTTYTPISKPDYSTPTEYQTSNSRMELYMSRRLPHKLSTQNLPPPNIYASSASAKDNSSTSSRFSETPSPFSRISTPNTSATSYSPQAAAPKLTPPRLRPVVSPTKSRPPVVRRKMPGGTPVEEYSFGRGLPSVRENNREASNQSSSSSSNSTIKASDLIDPRNGKAVLSGKLDRSPPPVAPLRISSKRLPRPPLADHSEPPASDGDDHVEPSRGSAGDRQQSGLPSAGTKSPPLRPSRIGAPRVASLEQSESPVIQSNLPHLATTGHTRRESLEQAAASPDRTHNESPRRWLAKSPPKESSATVSSSSQSKSRSSSKHRQIPSLNTTELPRASKRDPSPASTSSASRSRFGLFSRRAKPADDPPPSASRKGPVAGTGHEAYGKFSKVPRGRSGSTSSSGSREKSASPSTGKPRKSRQDSFTSHDGTRPDNDDFFVQRLKPVVISGGGAIKSNRNSQSGIGASVYASSSGQSSVASIGSSVIYDRKTTVTSSESSASMISTAPSDQRASRSLLPAPKLTTKAESAQVRSLAHRRSQQKFSQGEQNVRIPAPINTDVAISKLVLDSRDTAQYSVPETSGLPTDASEGSWAKSGGSKDKGKSRMRSPRRWNIFSRNRSRSPKKTSIAIDSAPPSLDEMPPMSVSINDMPHGSLQAHYIQDMMEEGDFSPDGGLEDHLTSIEDELELRDENGVIVTDAEDPEPEPRQISMLLPSPPKLNAEFPRLEPSRPVMESQYPPERQYISEEQQSQPQQQPQPQPQPQRPEEPVVRRRPSRLQRVGRIPNQYTHRPKQSSFSRPFDSSGRPSLDEAPMASSVGGESTGRPKLTLRTEQLQPTTRVEQWRQNTLATAPPSNAYLYGLEGDMEFMSFATDRQDSQMSQSSSSGNASFMNMIAQRAQQTAQRPGEEPLTESEDLTEGGDEFALDSPEGEKLLSAFPSLTNVRRATPTSSPENKEAPSLENSRLGMRPRKSNSPPLPDKPEHLAIPPHLHPATQSHNKSNSSDIYSDYNQSGARRRRLSNASSVSDSRYSSQTTISSSSHVSAFVASPVNQVTRAMARKTHSTRDSLRFSALMTSRWLSFDRVLFSPVAEDILSLSIQSPRILILDGLANDDWSAYTALSYPNATVYNLSTTPKLRTPSPHGDEWANPPNHKLLPLPSMAHPFPFPKGFFAAVVVRFPPLLPQHHLNSVIAEAKRVLRPGGYLEMTLLDIDPVNLGPKTRKEVKRVKMRAQQRMPDAGLAPVGDATMKLLARRGFEGLRSAVLGVPVATSSDSDAIQGPGSLPFNEERASDTDGTSKPTRTLGDLLREAGDETGAGIASQYPVAQTISRVARWWWSRCYEGLASVDGNDERGTLLGLRGRGEEDSRSMWADPAIVSECEDRGTNLRLVLAYAVKPMVVRRRTVSV